MEEVEELFDEIDSLEAKLDTLCQNEVQLSYEDVKSQKDESKTEAMQRHPEYRSLGEDIRKTYKTLETITEYQFNYIPRTQFLLEYDFDNNAIVHEWRLKLPKIRELKLRDFIRLHYSFTDLPKEEFLEKMEDLAILGRVNPNRKNPFYDLSESKIEILLSQINRLRKNPEATRYDFLLSEFDQYEFFALDKVNQLSEESQKKLFDLIIQNQMPYCIAMFDYLGFIAHINSKFTKTKSKTYVVIGKWFDSDKTGRAVKGNISTLNKISNEDRVKYTAHLHQKTVENDYQKLK